MAHVPHVLLPGPWDGGDRLVLAEPVRRHLATVLRRGDGSPVSYTDGAGTVGEGTLDGGAVRRGAERRERRPAPPVAVAVAPPHRADRARFVVEKLAELGVDRLVWLRAAHGAGRVPRREKADAWAAAALEQSRGAWLMAVEGPVTPAELAAPLWVADASGPGPPSTGSPVTVAVGPEGGFAAGEIPEHAVAIGLGPTTLRTETAAVAAAVVALQAAGRFPTPD